MIAESKAYANLGGTPLVPLEVQIGTATLSTVDERVAVFVVHGMGQQVRFEGIDEIVQLLIKELNDLRGSGLTDYAVRSVTTRTIRLVSEDRARAEILLVDSQNASLAIDVYEGYWAPIAEGKATLKDAVDFLYAAGKAGYGFSTYTYQRLRHGTVRPYLQKPWMKLLFIYLLAVVASFVAINAGLTAIAAQIAFFNLGARNDFNKHIVSIDVVLLVPVLVALVSGLVIGLIRLFARRDPDPYKQREGRGPGFALRWLLVYLTFGSVMLAALGVLYVFKFGPIDPIVDHPWLKSLGRAGVWGAAALFSLWLALGTFVKRYLLDYVGDLAIYFSGHKSSKFHDTRDAIQESVCNVLNDVFDASDPAGKKAHLYDRVYVVAHSLGSVVAYDALNSAYKSDQLDPTRKGRDAAKRTKLFLTLGSPLDKSAFLFRVQHAKTAMVREGLGTAVQPMIVDYASRPERWVNVWSPDDPISGPLDYYDDHSKAFIRVPPGSPTQKGVENLQDPFADVPLAAHSHYFGNPLLRRVLAEAIL